MYYVEGLTLPFEEDETHEFKGHRNIAVEELPTRRGGYIPGTNRRSRRAVSRTLNAFLNTGRGGTVYLGVTDGGLVLGLSLTLYQKDHLSLSLDDLMSRYNPSVLKSCYKLEYVPVVPQGSDPQCHIANCSEKANSWTCRKNLLMNSHLLRTSAPCWCDTHALRSTKIPKFVVEITVFPFVQSPNNLMALHPIYEDEEERCYFRRRASVQAYSHQEVAEFTIQEVRSYFHSKIEDLRQKLRCLADTPLSPPRPPRLETSVFNS
ncbi:hypothetical protein EMCRGX_G031677 [Ephydatia muelleri]